MRKSNREAIDRRILKAADVVKSPRVLNMFVKYFEHSLPVRQVEELLQRMMEHRKLTFEDKKWLNVLGKFYDNTRRREHWDPRTLAWAQCFLFGAKQLELWVP